MDWVTLEYPNTIYVVEVKYSGDVAISTCRCKDDPPERDNSYGFTRNFCSYDEARKYGIHVAEELQILAIV